ncbi:MAG: radical SAM protein [candidate division WOR-3 bacterium]
MSPGSDFKKVSFINLKGVVIHDFPYPLRQRKCPHTALISLTNSGGCIFRCPMCYARAYLWSEPDRIKIYKNLPEKLESEIKRLKIAFPFYLSQITDPLQPIVELRNLTYRILRTLMRYRLSFRIVTKSAEGLRDLIGEIPELISYPYWFVEITIEAPPKKQMITSPYASEINERISVLKFLNGLGIETVCRTDPTVLGLIEPEDLIWIIENVKKTGTKHIIASTGYYNKISMENLLRRLEGTKFQTCIPRIKEYYRYKPDKQVRRFMAPFEIRKKFHLWFKKEVEARGLTYAVCQELSWDYDSKDIPNCEGTRRNHVHIKIKNGFIPIDCSGDCLRSCPDAESPPCGMPVLRYEYPYKIKTLQITPASGDLFLTKNQL